MPAAQQLNRGGPLGLFWTEFAAGACIQVLKATRRGLFLKSGGPLFAAHYHLYTAGGF